MKYPRLSRLLVKSAAAAIMLLPLNVFAYPLSISNLSKSFISVKINGACSPDYGVINSMVTHTVETARIQSVCGAKAARCLGQLYNNQNCSGTSIADFYFNTKTRTTGEAAAVAPYSIRVEPSRVTLLQR